MISDLLHPELVLVLDERLSAVQSVEVSKLLGWCVVRARECMYV